MFRVVTLDWSNSTTNNNNTGATTLVNSESTEAVCFPCVLSVNSRFTMVPFWFPSMFRVVTLDLGT